MYFPRKPLSLQTLCSIIRYMSALTHLQTSIFLEKAVEFTNPMFNFQRHVCPNLRKNTCISRENSWVYKPYVHASYGYLRLCRIPNTWIDFLDFHRYAVISVSFYEILWKFIDILRVSLLFVDVHKYSVFSEAEKQQFHPRGVETTENLQFYQGENEKHVCSSASAKVPSAATLLKTAPLAADVLKKRSDPP